MFARVRFFKITGYDASTGAPTLDKTAIKLYTPGATEQEINNRSISLELDSSSVSLEADNRKKTTETVKGANITLTAYGVDETALSALTGFEKGDDGLNMVVNTGEQKHFAMVFNGKQTNGTEYTCYLQDVTINTLLPNAQQDGDSAEETSISGYASALVVNGKATLGRLSYSGEADFLAQSAEPDSAKVTAVLAK